MAETPIDSEKSNKKNLNCPHCSFEASFPVYLKKHFMEKHPEVCERNDGYEQYWCDICDAPFYLLAIHVAKEHFDQIERMNEDIQSKFYCTFCHKYFRNLKTHFKSVHADGATAKARLACPMKDCDYRTKAVANMKVHLKTKHMRSNEQAEALIADMQGVKGPAPAAASASEAGAPVSNSATAAKRRPKKSAPADPYDSPGTEPY
ncbi:Zinc finger BED-type [Carpediemonas membranifera]|uniref:Zinc finger BED-type n=1 Tax=Carpediemonas membranifera TaxID=201153 RepID=A0A8J6DYF1_9EUKA|nr:Zinc finger BED-type [Carpediemonas membranifera]|eukprot:KAG9392124.1 Zinc finger BED-type [Carpediemonas membranifera]